MNINNIQCHDYVFLFSWQDNMNKCQCKMNVGRQTNGFRAHHVFRARTCKITTMHYYSATLTCKLALAKQVASLHSLSFKEGLPKDAPVRDATGATASYQTRCSSRATPKSRASKFDAPVPCPHVGAVEISKNCALI